MINYWQLWFVHKHLQVASHTHAHGESEYHSVRKLCQETWQVGETRHLKKAVRQRRDAGGRRSSSTDLLFSLSAQTDSLQFLHLSAATQNIVCVCACARARACVCACLFILFLFFSLPRQHRYSGLGRAPGLVGINRTQTFSLKHSHSSSHTHTHKAGIPPDVTLALLVLYLFKWQESGRNKLP